MDLNIWLIQERLNFAFAKVSVIPSILTKKITTVNEKIRYKLHFFVGLQYMSEIK